MRLSEAQGVTAQPASHFGRDRFGEQHKLTGCWLLRSSLLLGRIRHICVFLFSRPPPRYYSNSRLAWRWSRGDDQTTPMDDRSTAFLHQLHRHPCWRSQVCSPPIPRPLSCDRLSISATHHAPLSVRNTGFQFGSAYVLTGAAVTGSGKKKTTLPDLPALLPGSYAAWLRRNRAKRVSCLSRFDRRPEQRSDDDGSCLR